MCVSMKRVRIRCVSWSVWKAYERPQNELSRGKVSAQFRKHALCSEPTGGHSLEFIARRFKDESHGANFMRNTFSMVSHQIKLPSAEDRGVEMTIFDMSKNGSANFTTIRYF